MEMEVSEELAYWLGVAQSDGHIELKNNQPYALSISVSKKSLPMIEKFKNISKTFFITKANIFKLKNREMWCFHMGVKRFNKLFENLDIKFKDPPTPPLVFIKDNKLFGAYLAGLIDGDGDVTLKRPKYPQFLIRITSGAAQTFLAKAIKKKLNCSVSIYHRAADKILQNRKIHGEWFELHFLVSSKNYKFVKEYILSDIAIAHKKERLEEYIIERFGI